MTSREVRQQKEKTTGNLTTETRRGQADGIGKFRQEKSCEVPWVSLAEFLRLGFFGWVV